MIESSLAGVDVDTILQTLEILNNQIFGGLATILVIILIIGAIANKNQVATNINFEKNILLLIPGIVTFLIVANVSPFITDRYIYSIYFAIYISLILMYYQTFPKMHRIVILLFVALNIITYRTEFVYLYQQEVVDEKENGTYENSSALYVYKDGLWCIMSNLEELKELESVMILKENNVFGLAEENEENDEGLFLYIENTADESSVLEEMIIVTGLNTYEKIEEQKYADLYYFYYNNEIQYKLDEYLIDTKTVLNFENELESMYPYIRISGIYGQENTGRWTDEDTVLTFMSEADNDIIITIDGKSFQSDVETKFYMNGHYISSWVDGEKNILYIDSAMLNDDYFQNLQIYSENAKSPQEFGSSDTRDLGVFIYEIEINIDNE
ncbi:MAG: hypothetical protein R3Y47_07555 [Lachnospiraceae bacterium]